MKNLTATICIVIMSILAAQSQTADSYLKNFKALYRATYTMSFQPDSNDTQRRVSGLIWHLFACNQYSFIVNYEWYKRDSVIRTTAALGKEMALASMGTLLAMPQPRATFRIFTDRTNRRITNINTINIDEFAYTEPLDLMTWQIEPETRKIGNLQTQKATGSFAGRDYIAWFTRQIPLPLGPHNFNGLPGLIVEIEDTRQHHRWELIDFKPVLQYVRVIPSTPVVATTRQGFREKRRNFYDDPIAAWEAMGVVFDEENRRKAREKLRARQAGRSNNPIELRRD